MHLAPKQMKRKSMESEEVSKEGCDRRNGHFDSDVKKVMVAEADSSSDSSASTSVANGGDKEFAECWTKFGLNNQPCTLHNGANPK